LPSQILRSSTTDGQGIDVAARVNVAVALARPMPLEASVTSLQSEDFKERCRPFRRASAGEIYWALSILADMRMAIRSPAPQCRPQRIHGRFASKPTREIPRLCRGGSNSSTFQGVDQRNRESRAAKRTKGVRRWTKTKRLLAGEWRGMRVRHAMARGSGVSAVATICRNPIEAVT